MAIVQRIMGSGVSPLAATNIQGDVAAGLTAAGTTQTDALALSAAQNYLTTTGSNTGVQLPATAIGDSIYVYNGGSNTLKVYGQTGESFTNGSANGSFSVATLKGCIFTKVSSTNFGVVLSA